MNLNEIKTHAKKSTERFIFDNTSLDFTLSDFWSWSLSDLVENRNRGILAEFIVKQALNIESPTRLEWDAFDLETNDGIKIEIKSSAYIQAWKQNKLSHISFGIAPTRELLDDNNYSKELKRQADIYIFCLLHHKDQNTINPMNLNQWTFYLVKTATLDEAIQLQKSISLSTIKMLEHKECNYINLRSKFDLIKK
jgi:hypothetical protein